MRLRLVAALLVIALDLPARADDDQVSDRHDIAALVETIIQIAIPGTYYWCTQSKQEVDWTLHWDWPSWKAKLVTFDALRFDTNPFYVNAIRHPLNGVIDYQIGRTNGFGMLGSTLLAYGSGAFWEYLVEYREYPAINDLIMNGAGGLPIGEALWEIGQLWRGGVQSTSDYVKTALFSPLDVLHAGFGRSQPWWRPLAWRSIAFAAGGAARTFGDRTWGELVVTGDIDIVRDGRYLTPGARSYAIRAGTWSRIRGDARFGDAGAGNEAVGTFLTARTAFAGRYAQDDAGDGAFVGVGAAFTYRRDRLTDRWDHIAFAHLFGPQIQLSRRTPIGEVRWDTAAYGDFAMIDAHAFGTKLPFPPPPPYLSTIQVNGYYDGAGVSAMTRLRADTDAWHFDGELESHRIWQLDGADRADPPPVRSNIPQTATGVTDWRLFVRTELGYRRRSWTLAATVDAAYRGGQWRQLERTTWDHAFGALLRADL